MVPALALRGPESRGAAGAAAVAALALLVFACGGEPRGACRPAPELGELGTVCGFENPEDVEPLPAADLLLVSEMRVPGRSGGGAIAALPASAGDGGSPLEPRRLWPPPAGEPMPVGSGAGDPTCTAPPSVEAWSPHGIASAAADGATRVAAVGHGAREAIELFELRGRGAGASLVWQGCIPMPADVVANDVAFARPGGWALLATDYAPSLQGWRGAWFMISGGLGRDTGRVLSWSRERGWRALPGTTAPLPNGVALSPEGRYVYWAETGSGRIVRIPGPASGEAFAAAAASADIGGHPDNLSWSPRGTLLTATHTEGFGFVLCALGRAPCRTGWSIFEIDPETMRAKELLHHDGSALGAVASVAELHGRLYLGAVFDDRIGVWRPPAGAATNAE